MADTTDGKQAGKEVKEMPQKDEMTSPLTRRGRSVKKPQRYTVSGEPTPEEKERRERRAAAANEARALQRARVQLLKAERALLVTAKKAAQAEAKAARKLVRDSKQNSKRKSTAGIAARVGGLCDCVYVPVAVSVCVLSLYLCVYPCVMHVESRMVVLSLSSMLCSLERAIFRDVTRNLNGIHIADAW
jgi:hypothetical protein